MTGSVEEFDWLDDLTAGVEERDARTEQRRKLRADIARLDEMSTMEELSELQERVASALAGTKAGIAVARQSGDAGALARAEYAFEKFSRAVRRIDGRRRFLTVLARTAAERERTVMKDARRAEQLAFEKERMEERRRLEEAKRAAAEARSRAEEARTRRHIVNRDRDHRVKVNVIRLIRSRGLLDEGTVLALFKEAEAMADAEDASPAGGP